jgi:chitinase
MKRFLACLLLTYTPVLFAQTTPWVSAYYAGWMQGDLPPSAIDFSAVTHIIHFSISPSGGANISGAGNGITPTTSAAICQAAHAAGKKVIITLGGWGDAEGLVTATNATNRAAFVTTLVNFILANGYDGIDIDWEPITSTSQFQLFIPALRAALDLAKPGCFITIAAMDGDGAKIAPVASYFDQINIMTYDMSGAWDGWVTWHNSPIYNGGNKFPGLNTFLPSANGSVDEFIAAGVPKSKIGIGADFYGYVWKGVSQPLQSWSNPPDVTGNVSYAQLMSTYASATALWDSGAGAAYISVPANGGTFVSLDNERTMLAKADYVRNKGIGGIILWELGGGYRPSAPAGQRDKLLQAVKQGFFGGTPPTGDTVKPSISFTVPAASATISGTATVTASASDNVGVIGVQFRVDGVNAGNEIASAPFTSTVNTWAYANGAHTLSAIARDFAGNTATASISVTVSNTGTPPPTTDLVVFDDALHSPFSDASWSANANYNNASPVQTGTKSVKVDFSGYGGFDILSGTWGAEIPIDIAKYDTLRFAMYPVTSATYTLAFYVGSTTTLTPPTGKWTTYAIPIPRQEFSRFYIMSEASGARSAYFDAIRFTGGTPHTTSAGEDPNVIREFALSQNYPNPFNPTTAVSYQLPAVSQTFIAIYDLLGREVKVLVNERKNPGRYEITWDAAGIPSGVYICRMSAGDFTSARKLTLVK